MSHAELQVVVATYLDASMARQEAQRLEAAGFASVEVVQPVEPVWQVTVDRADAHDALKLVLSDEMHAIEKY